MLYFSEYSTPLPCISILAIELKIFPKIFEQNTIQIIFTTHDPLTLSDIPDNNIPKEIDILVIDEISMVDLILLTNLLKVVKPKKLIILGDIKQLPPINGYGNIARTLEKYLSNNTNNSIHLANMTKSHRATNATYIDLSLKLRDEQNGKN